MTTKAIHIELVSSLSAESFIAALHRFVGRRGNVAEMFSDNGKNFIGANRQLKELRTLFTTDALKKGLDEFCQNKGISWSFNAPQGPTSRWFVGSGREKCQVSSTSCTQGGLFDIRRDEYSAGTNRSDFKFTTSLPTVRESDRLRSFEPRSFPYWPRTYRCGRTFLRRQRQYTISLPNHPKTQTIVLAAMVV